jgi:hypothetical protein
LGHNQRFFFAFDLLFRYIWIQFKNIQRYQPLFSDWPDTIFYFSSIGHKNHKDELETNSRRTRDEPLKNEVRMI